jgi:hypothetical protein
MLCATKTGVSYDKNVIFIFFIKTIVTRAQEIIVTRTQETIVTRSQVIRVTRCNTPSPLRLGLSLFFFYNKIFAKIHKVYQST